MRAGDGAMVDDDRNTTVDVKRDKRDAALEQQGEPESGERVNDNTRDANVHDSDNGSAGNAAAKKDNNGKKKHKIRFFDGIKVSRMLGTATAAVTTSLISTHFLSTFSTVIVLFLTSIITGLSVELWSRTIHRTGRDAAKIVARIPYEKILPDPVAGSINEKLENVIREPEDEEDQLDTDEYREIRDALLNDPEFQAAALASASHDSTVDPSLIVDGVIDGDALTVEDTVDIPVDEYTEYTDKHGTNNNAGDAATTDDSVAGADSTAQDNHRDGSNGDVNGSEHDDAGSDDSRVETKPYAWVQKFFGLDAATEKSPMWRIFRLIILFCAVSGLTMGGVWIAETFLTEPDVTNVYKTTGLSKSDKQAIYDATQQQIDDKLSELEDLDSRMDTLTANVTELQNKLQALTDEDDNTSTSSSSANTSSTNSDGTSSNNSSGSTSQSTGSSSSSSSSASGNSSTGTGSSSTTTGSGSSTSSSSTSTSTQDTQTKQEISTMSQQLTDLQSEVDDLKKQLEILQQSSTTSSSSTASPSPSASASQ